MNGFHRHGLPGMPFLDRFVSYTYQEGQGAYFNCPLIVDGKEVPSQAPYITTEVTDFKGRRHIKAVNRVFKVQVSKPDPFPAPWPCKSRTRSAAVRR